MTGEDALIDIKDTVRDDPDFTVYAVPLLGEKDDIHVIVAMLQEVRQTALIEVLEITTISEEGRFIDADKGIVKVIHTDTLIVDIRDAGDVVPDVAIDIPVLPALHGLEHQVAHHRGLTGPRKTKVERYSHQDLSPSLSSRTARRLETEARTSSGTGI